MTVLVNDEHWLDRAAEFARRSTCQRVKCGAVLVSFGQFVSAGWNSPPPGALARCRTTVPSKLHPKTDRTCCVHAEWRALLQGVALDLCYQTTLYFTRVDLILGNRVPSGLPYCTVGSRLALEVGVSSWVIEHEEGVRRYTAREFDALTYRYDDRMEGRDVER